ncbi:Ankyrin repeat protein [Giardia lamblia P15]|uniref:Ankyrin repeat protein n=1 Tax=Giardia intestinalis (strain P15) TaxID=658858 RepID=E1F6M5_GIAIA|nr:Ankyrin repeat protein [Giardia lamblia P15]
MQSAVVSVTDVIASLHELRHADSIALNTYKDFRAPKTGDTVLHIAASIGVPEAIFFAHSLDLDVNVRNKAGETPLHLAVVEDNLEVVDALLENGADVNCRNESGQTALHYAVIFNAHESLNRVVYRGGVDFLIQDSVGWTALHYSAVNADLDVMQLLLSMEPRLLEMVSAMGVSILHLLSLSNSVIICQNGAPNVTYTVSFLYDSKRKHVCDHVSEQDLPPDDSSVTEVKRALSTIPANVGLVTRSSTVAIEYSSDLFVTNESYERCIRWLLMDFVPTLVEKEINVDALFGCDLLRRTPLHYAAFMGSYRSLYTIVSYIHARVKQCCQAGTTGSCLSTMKWSSANEDAILCGVSPFLAVEGGVGFDYFAHPDNAGLSPLQLACMSGVAAAKIKLLSTVCDVTTYTQALGNALHCAIRSGSLHTVSELVGVVSRMLLLKTSGDQSTFLLDFLTEKDYNEATSFAMIFKGNRTIHQVHALVTEYNKLVLLLDSQSLLLFLLQVSPLRLLIKATGLLSRTMLLARSDDAESDEVIIEEIFSMVFNWYDGIPIDIYCLLFPTGVFQIIPDEHLTTQDAYSILKEFAMRPNHDRVIPTSLESLAVMHLREWKQNTLNTMAKDKSQLVLAINKDRTVYSAILQILKSYSCLIMRPVKQVCISKDTAAPQAPTEGLPNAVKTIEDQYASILSALQDYPKHVNISKNLTYETSEQTLTSHYFLGEYTKVYNAVLEAPPLLSVIVDAVIYNNKIALMLLLSNTAREEVLSRIGAKYGNSKIAISLDCYLSLVRNGSACDSCDGSVWGMLSEEPDVADGALVSRLFSDLHLSFETLWRAELIMNAVIVSIFTNNYGMFCILCSLMPATHYRCDVLLFLLGTLALAQFDGSSKRESAINDKYERLQKSVYRYIEFILDHMASVPATRIAIARTTVIAGSTNILKDLSTFSSSSTSLDDCSLKGAIRSILPLITIIQERLIGKKPETPTFSHASKRLGLNASSSPRQIPFIALLIIRGQDFGQGLLKYALVFTQLSISYAPDIEESSRTKKGMSAWHYFSSESYNYPNRSEPLYPVPELFRRATKNLVTTYGIEQHLSNTSSVYASAKALQLRVKDRSFMMRMDDVTKRTRKIKTMKLFEGHKYNRHVINGEPPNPTPAFGLSMVDIESVEEMILSTSNDPTRIYEDGTTSIASILFAITTAVIAWTASLRYKLEFIYERISKISQVLGGCSIEFTYDDMKIIQLLCLIRLGTIDHALTGSAVDKDEHDLAPLELAVRCGSPTSFILLMLYGCCFNAQSEEHPSLNPFTSTAAKVEAQLVKRIEAACSSASPAPTINALHMLLTVSVFNPSFINLLTNFKASDTGTSMFTSAHVNIIQTLLEQSPMKLQLVVDPNPIDNLIRCYLVSTKASSMHCIVTNKTVKDVLREWSLLRHVGTGSLCHVCNQEGNIIERFIGGTQPCICCGRAMCTQCEVYLGKMQRRPCVVCASCYTHKVCPGLLGSQTNYLKGITI